MIANYHTHTYYCGHASGTPEEYIRGALDMGLDTLGFSDHAPFRCADGFEAGYRVPVEDALKQRRELEALRERYADRLFMPIGYEMEYFPERFPEMLGYVKSLGAEYLLLGQHFLDTERPGGKGSMRPTSDPRDLAQYVFLVTEAMKTGVFSYAAHPDCLNFTGPAEEYQRVMRRICETSLETDTPLEINLLGIASGRHYPNPLFWEIAGELGCRTVIGIDAHAPGRFYEPGVHRKAAELAERFGLKPLERVELKKL